MVIAAELPRPRRPMYCTHDARIHTMLRQQHRDAVAGFGTSLNVEHLDHASVSSAHSLRVCVVGDSIATGTGDRRALSWHRHLATGALSAGADLTHVRITIGVREWLQRPAPRWPTGGAAKRQRACLSYQAAVWSSTLGSTIAPSEPGPMAAPSAASRWRRPWTSPAVCSRRHRGRSTYRTLIHGPAPMDHSQAADRGFIPQQVRRPPPTRTSARSTGASRLWQPGWVCRTSPPFRCPRQR